MNFMNNIAINIKSLNNTELETIQEELFNMGLFWTYNSNRIKTYINKEYIYINNGELITIDNIDLEYIENVSRMDFLTFIRYLKINNIKNGR